MKGQLRFGLPQDSALQSQMLSAEAANARLENLPWLQHICALGEQLLSQAWTSPYVLHRLSWQSLQTRVYSCSRMATPLKRLSMDRHATTPLN